MSAIDFIKQVKEKEECWYLFRKECFTKDKMYKNRIKLSKKTNVFKQIDEDKNVYHKEFTEENKRNQYELV